MPVPADGLPGPLSAFLADLERRIDQLEGPRGFQGVFRIASTDLTAASAKSNGGRWGIATDLKTVVFSDGVHWYRADTGAVIV